MVGWLGFNGMFSTIAKVQKSGGEGAGCPPPKNPHLGHYGFSPWPIRPCHSLPPQISLPKYACVLSAKYFTNIIAF